MISTKTTTMMVTMSGLSVLMVIAKNTYHRYLGEGSGVKTLDRLLPLLGGNQAYYHAKTKRLTTEHPVIFKCAFRETGSRGLRILYPR